ncbi:synaptogenesis protein syg-2-like [Argiope bruennichi]|nr:synaptogenesis protein syg-2-like [Argiope bruennichi]
MFRGHRCMEHILENFILFLSCLTVLINCMLPVPLRINSFHVPTPAVTGDSILLRCAYELGNETLYSVKWYKNAGEFFRYVPASEPPLKMFPQNGIDVDMSKSDQNNIYLRNLSLESHGNYTCQVSTDRPFFRCVQTTRQLEVVVPPSDGPILTEEKSDYEVGDNVSILCNSGKSKPAPELKWYINDQLAQSDLYDKETVVYPDQLESSSLALRFRLKPDVLHNGKVILKCVATLKHIHAVTIKEIRAAASKEASPFMLSLLLIAATFLISRLTRD